VGERLTGDEAVGGFGDVGFGSAGVGFRGAGGPEWESGLLGVGDRCKEGEGEEKAKSHDNIVLRGDSSNVLERPAGSLRQSIVCERINDLAIAGIDGVFGE
jgi:hypothetical protein